MFFLKLYYPFKVGNIYIFRLIFILYIIRFFLGGLGHKTY